MIVHEESSTQEVALFSQKSPVKVGKHSHLQLFGNVPYDNMPAFWQDFWAQTNKMKIKSTVTFRFMYTRNTYKYTLLDNNHIFQNQGP